MNQLCVYYVTLLQPAFLCLASPLAGQVPWYSEGHQWPTVWPAHPLTRWLASLRPCIALCATTVDKLSLTAPEFQIACLHENGLCTNTLPTAAAVRIAQVSCLLQFSIDKTDSHCVQAGAAYFVQCPMLSSSLFTNSPPLLWSTVAILMSTAAW